MAVKSETVTIDGLKFEVVQLPGMRSWDLLMELVELLSPAAAKAMSGANLQSLGDVDVGQLGAGLESLFARLNRQKRTELMGELFSSVLCNGVPVMDQFDTLFQGKPHVVFKLIKEALRVNYRSFSTALGSELTKALGAAKTRQPPFEVLNTSSG
jgi:hypothetical protein